MRVGVLLLLVSAGSCGNSASSAPAPTLSPDARRSDADGAVAGVVPTVVALPDDGQLATVRVSLARSEAQHQRGLMYVQNLPPDDGMLFLFDDDTDRAFWMKNTLIPLDMIFIRTDMTVAGIVANAKPLTTEPRSVGKESHYVLEVNGGWAARHGVVAGTRMRFENVQP